MAKVRILIVLVAALLAGICGLTTVSAQRKLAEGGVRGRAGRAVVDQVAAVELLQHWLDRPRA